ncbi:uncharacterized protein LOC113237856 [Hyposmocoma kahamanoa]|uniref:uncharacterized protein LOC113237856 n=1 Tax=Hyposmocoma kahamanoa TaxID=1477025 RepID=UPI000E6D6BF6|nr:uncharacterized protein LOC113237856 [Hyposmocoma kahamanoa]
MECSEFLRNCDSFFSNRTVWRLIRNGCRITRQAVYAGLLLFFVPSVLCDADWPNHLTFDQIFNNTQYVHLQHRTRPYSTQYNLVHLSTSPRYTLEENNLASKYNLNKYKDVVSGNKYTNSLEEDSRGNELDLDYDYSLKDRENAIKVPLLVGFSHDPFRYSVPEDDYMKGVRHMNPTSIMGKGENRGKRGVLHLYNMMYCATGCEPLAYKGYGCYCGFLGAGRPTDGIDRCCKMHDECYENIYCPFFTVYFQPYYWKCYRGQPLCALENYRTQHQFINGCAARLCECDRRFAMCVKRYSCPKRRALCRSSPIRLLQNLLMFR